MIRYSVSTDEVTHEDCLAEFMCTLKEVVPDVKPFEWEMESRIARHLSVSDTIMKLERENNWMDEDGEDVAKLIVKLTHFEVDSDTTTSTTYPHYSIKVYFTLYVKRGNDVLFTKDLTCKSGFGTGKCFKVKELMAKYGYDTNE